MTTETSSHIELPEDVCEAVGVQKGVVYSIRALQGGVLMLVPIRGRAVAARRALRDNLQKEGVTLEQMLSDLRQLRDRWHVDPA